MVNKVIFYNHFGAGDIHESREFVKDIMGIIPSNQYIYAHGKGKKLLVDIPNLEYMEVTQVMRANKPFELVNDDLYINTWIGHNSKYVLPQVGCIIDKNFEMFNDTLKKAGYGALTRPMMDYLPIVDFTKFEISNVDKFMSDNENKRKVLICNGNVNSCQAENFSFEEPIYTVADNHKDMIFFVTQRLPIERDNIYCTSDVIQAESFPDLNEIAYIAQFVECIVGRKSGPFVFAHTKETWHSDKKSLSFTYAKHSSHFVKDDDKFPLRKYWSSEVTPDKVISEMEKVINE